LTPGQVVAKWLAGERVVIGSRRMLFALAFVSLFSLAYAWREWRGAISSLTTTRPPAPIPPDQGDVRFGVALSVRKKVFEELAGAEPGARAEGKRAFPGGELAWSAEDHRGSFERQKVAELEGRYRLSRTQIYLILDEGIRQKWPGPDGQPLPPYVVPLHPRRKYGW